MQPMHPRWLAFLLGLGAVSLGTGACASTGTLPSTQSRKAAGQGVVTAAVPGIPNRPNLVTAVPFYWKPGESNLEKNMIAIPAEVDGRHGIFIFDMGATFFNLNRTFLQPSPTGGVDTVTDTNHIPDHVGGTFARNTWDKVHVTMRIGTLLDTFNEPNLLASEPPRTNAFLNHYFGNFEGFFAPVLGNISLTVVEPFETIIDYQHRRVVLIRLDPAGHRLTPVPAYTPRWSTALVDITKDMVAQRDVNKEVAFNVPGAVVGVGIRVRPDDTVDTLAAAHNTKWMMLDTGAFGNSWLILGNPFLSSLGMVGFNQRTHQFILYQ